MCHLLLPNGISRFLFQCAVLWWKARLIYSCWRSLNVLPSCSGLKVSFVYINMCVGGKGVLRGEEGVILNGLDIYTCYSVTGPSLFPLFSCPLPENRQRFIGCFYHLFIYSFIFTVQYHVFIAWWDFTQMFQSQDAATNSMGFFYICFLVFFNPRYKKKR